MDSGCSQSKDSSKVTVPFYAVPTNAKTSSEIVSEARATVKTLDTKRPFTPRGEQRRLFGNVARSARPTSSLVAERFLYDATDTWVASTMSPRLEPFEMTSRRSRQPRGLTCCSPTHLTTLPEEGQIARKINSAPGRVRLPSLSPAKHLNRMPLEGSFVHNLIAADFQKRSLSLQEDDAKFLKRETRKCLVLSHLAAERDKTSPSRSMGKPKSRAGTSVEVLEPSLEARILPLIKSMAVECKLNDDSEMQLAAVVRQLYKVLNDASLLGKIFKQRSEILKAAFRLLDGKTAVLLLEVVRLCLVLNVGGNNLNSVCKVVFKITRHDCNDLLFLQNNLLELFLEVISNASPLRDSEALIYIIGSLKFLTMNSTLLREISRLRGVDVLTCQIARINEHKKTSGHISEQTSHVLFQLTGCLRNLAENSGNRHVFVACGAIGQLCLILECFPDDYDVIMNVARILSKLTMYYEVCNAMAENLCCFPATIQLIEKYKRKPDLIVRLCFAFGNVTAKNEEARVLLFRHPKCLDILLELVQLNLGVCREVESVDRRREFKEFVVPNETDKSNSVGDDVIVKTIRLLANLSVSVDVGRRIANDSLCLSLILTILGTKSVERHEEMVLSAAGALSNLSYYSTQNVTSPFFRPDDLVECLFRLLECENLEALIECLRILGNVSREEQIRRLLSTKKVLKTAIQLLESDNKDIIYLSCGLLMNFMIDKANRTEMKCQNGIHRLIRVLKEFGCKDWQLATVVCQTLWNYSCSDSSSDVPIEPGVASELLEVLHTYLDKNNAYHPDYSKEGCHEIAHDIWLLEFSPVANRLAQRIQYQTFPTKTTTI